MSEWATIILAGGTSTRMKSKLPKVLHTVCGRSLLKHVSSAVSDIGSSQTIYVESSKLTELHGANENLVKGFEVVVQPEPLGTADAVKKALSSVNRAENLIVGVADTPLLSSSTIKSLKDCHLNSGVVMTVLTAHVEDPSGFGRIVRDDHGELSRIVEESVSCEKVKQIKEVNAGWYCFNTHWLRNHINKITKSLTGEFFLTDLLTEAKNTSKVASVSVKDPIEALGVNDRVQLARVEKEMRNRVLNLTMLSGVTIRDPLTTYIDVDVVIGRDTVLLPGVHIGAGTSIGENCYVGPNSILSGCTLGDSVKIESSFVTDATIGDNNIIGPFSRIRPGTVTESHVSIGNYAEIKNSHIGMGSKIGHFSYIGDAQLGKNVNVGAGAITANFDGFKKNRTEICDDVFIGSNSVIVAPRVIGKGALTGAGSVIVRDVKDGERVAGVPAITLNNPKQEWRSEKD